MQGFSVDNQLCETCGNEFSAVATTCPYCGASRSNAPGQAKAPFMQRTINLERGMPQAKQAVERLRNELHICQRQQVRILTLIHGYGSSGKGGLVRKEVRRHLHFLQSQGDVREVIYGEDFHHKGGRGKQLLRRFPQLAEHRDLNKANPGVTLVVF